jgi:hypothetical protein
MLYKKAPAFLRTRSWGTTVDDGISVARRFADTFDGIHGVTSCYSLGHILTAFRNLLLDEILNIAWFFHRKYLKTIHTVRYKHFCPILI